MFVCVCGILSMQVSGILVGPWPRAPFDVEVEFCLVPGQGANTEIDTVSQVLLARYIAARNPQTLNAKKAIPGLTIVDVICEVMRKPDTWYNMFYELISWGHA